jgi:hypothetical protein
MNKEIEQRPKIEEKSKGKWFCRQCSRPINEGYSYDGLCVVCAEPFLNPDYQNY